MTATATAPERPAGELVAVAIARDPALVRTVRLVAAAVARRAGQDEGVVEEVRLAVGEACAVMIGTDGAATPGESDGEQVRVGLSAGSDGFSVTVTGHLGAADPSLDEFDLDPWVLLRGIDENLAVEERDGVTSVTASWPAA